MKRNFSQIIAFGAKLDSSVRTAASVYATIVASSYRVLHEGHITVLQQFIAARANPFEQQRMGTPG